MGLQPIIVDRFFNTRTNKLCSPGTSLVRCTNFDTIPLGSYFVVRINACKGYLFDLDPTTGLVPTAFQDATAFLAATGTPTFGVKTRVNTQAASTTFAAYANGYAADYTDLAKGQAAVGAIFPFTVTPDLDYVAQMTLRGVSETPMVAIPPGWLPIDIQNPVITGSETGSVPSPAAYSGVATIPVGDDHIAVSIPGLTVATGVVAALTQQDTGAGTSIFWSVITADTLTIYSGGNAPAATWEVYYALDSL